MIYWRYSRSTRFGNWLFQYGVAKTLAKGGDVAFYVDPSFDDSHVETLMKRAEVMRGLTVVRKLPENAHLMVGVPQDVHQMDEALIRDLYKVPTRIDEFIRTQYKDILASPVRVSIHVRRGDYLSLPHRHPFVGRVYLKHAVEKFPQDVLFVVCSDDLPWCKGFFTEKNFPGRHFAFVEGGGVLSDLYMATYCHHNIMSNSTFSWWGAYLNQHEGKRVILPSHWYGMAIGAKESAQNIENLRFPGVEVLENGYELKDLLKAVVLFCRVRLGAFVRMFIR